MMDGLQRAYGVERFILAGLCSGAATAFWASAKDPRIAGVLMMNARQHVTSKEWDDFVQTSAESKKYLRRALTDRSAWKRALTGKIKYRRLASVFTSRFRQGVRKSVTVEKVSRGLAEVFLAVTARGGSMLLVHSEGDVALEYLRIIIADHKDALARTGRFRSEIIRNADHIFDLARNHDALLPMVADWLRDAHNFGGPAPSPRTPSPERAHA